jgi:hypothetical protein
MVPFITHGGVLPAMFSQSQTSSLSWLLGLHFSLSGLALLA